MYTNILVPIALDHSRDTSTALDVARSLASKGATITALTVIEAVPAHVAAYLPADYGETLVDEVTAQLKAELGGVQDVKVDVVRGHAGQTIVDYATEKGIDCIVIASHKPGLTDYLIGSTATRVVRHAPCAVHVLR